MMVVIHAVLQKIKKTHTCIENINKTFNFPFKIALHQRIKTDYQ